MRRFDVAVIGSGPSGAIAALVLARAGRKVVLVDKGEIAPRRVGESLPSAARPLLKHLCLLPVVENGGHLSSFGNCSAWGTSDLVSADAIRDPNGLGWHLDRVRFDRDLRSAARDAGAEWLEARVDSLRQNTNDWVMQLTMAGDSAGNSTEVAADALIDASGRGAFVARKLGATRLRDDGLMSIYTWAKAGSADCETRTLIESTPEGWWYTSRLPDQTRIVAFHTDSGFVGDLVRSKERWLEALSETRHIRQLFDASAFDSEIKCTEASGARLDRFAGKGWLATGDAALCFDPLSSQGIFNALYTGMRAGEAVNAALSGHSHRIAAYVDRLEQIRSAYLAHRHFYYATEQRWMDRPFWNKRIFKAA